MKIIPRNIHAWLDYSVGPLLAASPWIFGFAGQGPATFIPFALGLAAIFYSLLTNYEGGFLRVIPFATHLALDFLSGLFLAISPWLFGFAEDVSGPHLAFGLLEMSAALMTRTRSVWRRAHAA